MENYEKTGYLEEPFRLFHLRDNAIKEVQLHYHDFYKIIVFYRGSVTYMIEGKSYLLKPGDIIFVPRGDIHKPTIDFSVPYERTILYISTEYLESCRDQEYDPFLCFLQASEKKSYVMRTEGLGETEAGRLLKGLEGKGERYGWKQERMLLFQLFLMALNRMCMEKGQKKESRPCAVYNQKVIDLLTYLGEHIFENISVDELADTFYISKYHMMRLFKKETGYTIHRYITEKRIAAAKEKLQKGIPATKVSEECGFSDYSTFLRAFQGCTGMTPTAFAEARKGRSLHEFHSLL